MPWGKIGGADIFNLNIIKYLNSKGYKVFIITTEVCNYENRENFEKVSEAFYDLTTFLPREYWADFIENIIKQYNIKLIFQMNSLYFYHLMPWIKYKYPKFLLNFISFKIRTSNGEFIVAKLDKKLQKAIIEDIK